MRLETISVRNFRLLRTTFATDKTAIVLVGSNNSGKISVMLPSASSSGRAESAPRIG